MYTMYNILVLFAYVICLCNGRFHVFKTPSSSTEKLQKDRYFILIHHSIRELVNDDIIDSLKLLGYHSIAYSLDSDLTKIASSTGQSLQLTASTIQPTLDRFLNIIHDIQDAYHYISNSSFLLTTEHSPALIKYEDDLHIALTTSKSPSKSVSTGNIELHWLNMTQRVLSKTTSSFLSNCSTSFDLHDDGITHIRALSINPTQMHIMYNINNNNNQNSNKNSIGIADLIQNDETHCFDVLKKKIIVSDDNNAMMHPEKYWSPVYLQGQMYYVTQVNPLTIIEINDRPMINHASNHDNMHNYTVFSKDTNVDFPQSTFWSSSELYGGANVVSIGRGRYLSFFTSRIILPNTKQGCYFLGAYTFTTKGFPFHITEISPFPITQKDWYHVTSNGGSIISTEDIYEHEIRPLSVIQDGETITLALDVKSKGTVIIKMDLPKLIDSLEKVNLNMANLPKNKHLRQE